MTTVEPPADSTRPATPLVEIVVNEDLTATAVTKLHNLLTDALELRPAQLVVDLAGCSYADAVAVDVLLNAHRRAWNIGARLTLRAPTPRVQRLLQLAHVDRVLNVTLSPPPPPTPTRTVASVQPVVP
jgi:anti-anti-sigma factor